MKAILAILVPESSAESSAAIAVRLSEMGASLTGWGPATNGEPARAYFEFDSEEGRDRFLIAALAVPGVSLERPIESDHSPEYVPQAGTA